MIKVMHITGSMNRGGAEVVIMDLLRNKSSEVHFDFLIHYNRKKGITKGDFDDEIKTLGANLFHIPTLWDLGISRYIKELEKIFSAKSPDIVHIHMNSKSGVIALAAKKAGIRTIITHSHADIKFRGNKLYTFVANREFWFQKQLIDKYSTQFWGCSTDACNSLFKKSKRFEFRIINNTVDIEQYQSVTEDDVDNFKRKFNISENSILLGNVGRIVSHKNILFIIELLNVLVKKNRNYTFVYAGREDDKAYHQIVQEKIKEYNLENNVIYLGLRDDVSLIMNVIDVFVGTALREGFGLVAVEAQAAGTPSILYKGFPKTVDMQLGLTNFMDDFTINDWVSAIENVELGKKLDKDVIKNKIQVLGFDSANNAKKISELYIELNGNK